MTEILKPQETKSTPPSSPDSKKEQTETSGEKSENKFAEKKPERIKSVEEHQEIDKKEQEKAIPEILKKINDGLDSVIDNLSQSSPTQGYSGFLGETVAFILKIIQELGLNLDAYATDFDEDDETPDKNNSAPSSRPKKNMTQEELSQFLQRLRKEKIDGKTAGDTVLNSIRDNIATLRGNHCWDWVDKIYKKANVKRKDIYPFRKYSGKDCGNLNYNDKLDILEPGDWIYINNRNNSDTWGCHSLIFLGWVDQDKKIAYTASCPRPGIGRAPETRDFSKNPVTYIAKPSFS